jgi:hypothetical protein
MIFAENALIRRLYVVPLRAGQGGIRIFLRQFQKLFQKLIEHLVYGERNADGLRGSAGDARPRKRAVPILEADLLHRIRARAEATIR